MRNPPPPVAPVLQIGITGHRTLPAADPALLQQTLRTVLDGIAAGARAAVARAWPGDCQPLEMRCISALAAGADQLAAGLALELGWTLAAPLPFARQTYRGDFTTADSLAIYDRLLGAAQTVYEMDGVAGRDDAYQAVGRVILEQSDILVAIWDGQVERGPGGTAEVVREARAADIPVVVIAAAAPHAVTVFAAEGLNTPQDLAAPILAAPHKAGKVDALALYYREHKFAVPRIATLLSRVERIALIGRKRPAAAAVAEAPASQPLEDAIAKTNAQMAPYLDSADLLAVRYATLYRATASLRYLAILPATAAALMAFYGPKPLQSLSYVVETGILFGTFLLNFWDKRAGWQRRFIDYRYMAERLRYASLMAMFGSTCTLPRLPPYQVAANSDWVNFYLRFAVRRLGLVTAQRDADFLAGLRQLLVRELEGQIAYFRARAADATVLGNRLQTAGVALYMGGIAFTVLRGGLNTLGINNGLAVQLVTAFALTVPALAPAFFGLRSQREYGRLAQRYEAMVRQLCQTEMRLNRDGAVHGQVERVAREAVEALLSEVSDWRILIKARDLSPY